mmetsp:Transcript_127000/g.179232  ORF Transcript_127000/g.179232 Transcript_127000/m.179232 type:complete len:201 (-) Transcript_127000:920-1522(-)
MISHPAARLPAGRILLTHYQLSLGQMVVELFDLEQGFVQDFVLVPHGAYHSEKEVGHERYPQHRTQHEDVVRQIRCQAAMKLRLNGRGPELDDVPGPPNPKPAQRGQLQRAHGELAKVNAVNSQEACEEGQQVGSSLGLPPSAALGIRVARCTLAEGYTFSKALADAVAAALLCIRQALDRAGVYHLPTSASWSSPGVRL